MESGWPVPLAFQNKTWCHFGLRAAAEAGLASHHFGTSKLLLNILAIWAVPAAVVLLDISWNLKLICRLKFLKSGESQFSLPLSSNQTKNWIQMSHDPPTLGKLKWTKTYCTKISGALLYWWSWQRLLLDSLIWSISLCGPLNTYKLASMTSVQLCTAE